MSKAAATCHASIPYWRAGWLCLGASPLPTGLCRQWKMTQEGESLPPTWETWMDSWLPILARPSPWGGAPAATSHRIKKFQIFHLQNGNHSICSDFCGFQSLNIKNPTSIMILYYQKSRIFQHNPLTVTKRKRARPGVVA